MYLLYMTTYFLFDSYTCIWSFWTDLNNYNNFNHLQTIDLKIFKEI